MFADIAMVTLLIIVINVAVSWKGFNDPVFFDKYKFQLGSIVQLKQHYRILSSGFLHVDMMHLVFNMLTLYFFANPIIAFFASPKAVLYGDFGHISQGLGYGMFLLVYLAAIVGGNIFSLFIHKNQPFYSAVGASGGVSGILFATIAVIPEAELRLFFAIPLPAWVFAIGYLGYSVYAMNKGAGNVGHAAHIGGAVVGLVATILYFPSILEVNLWYIVGMLVPLMVMTGLIIRKRIE